MTGTIDHHSTGQHTKEALCYMRMAAIMIKPDQGEPVWWKPLIGNRDWALAHTPSFSWSRNMYKLKDGDPVYDPSEVGRGHLSQDRFMESMREEE